ncbi:uncharacterized protein LOC129909272 [Episyrphus balteatus]|uniref:uncharacterized protein LOC129909272 n=1 Tax=Episyrphus balteatus TaxID=286459 RepID=UPI002485CAA2|nr:uncharacterized protein LOC129909272 [Episyrphus balteatus]
MTNESSSMTMKSDNESKLVNTTITSNNNIIVNNNNNNIYYTCNSSNKSIPITTTITVAATSSPASSTSVIVSDLPSITLAPFAKIKRETDCISTSNDYTNRSSSSSSMVVMKSVSNNSQVPTNNSNNNTVSAKMGSRRIFTPQFKLQVLESYRNDADCKGNQRATARKYNIHRRQIQKWLQCESNLRSSVANICANNVKHQFHNITHHHQMPIVTNSTLPLPSSSAAASSSSSIHSNNNQHHHHHAHHNQQQYKAINNRLSLDTTRHSVALTSIQIPTSKGVLAAAAQAAAAAATNNVGDVVGAVAPLSSSSPSSTAFLSSSTSTVKSLRAPTSPVLHSQILTKSSSSSSAVVAVSPSTKGGQSVVVGGATTPLHIYHHHDSMGIHTPPASMSSVPVSVPIITPHPHTHLHVTNLKIHHYQHLHMEQQQHHHHQHHHNLHHPYNQIQLPPPPPSSERRPFMPSASLPALPTSSSSSSSSSSSTFSTTTTTTSPSSPPASTPLTAVALSCTDTLATNNPAARIAAVSMPLAHVEENRIVVDELRDYRSTSTENRYMNENEYAAAVQSRTLMHRAYEGFHYLPLPMHMYPAATAATMIAPIDLSLGTKRLGGYSLASPSTLNENTNLERHQEYAETIIKYEQPSSPKSEDNNDDDDDDSQLNVVDSDISESSSSVVDLTLRKRKVLMPISGEITAEKHTKVNENETTEKPSSEPPKTFKLFKPYLLDEEEAKKSSDESSSKISKQKDPIIWSHHTACLSPPISIDSLQSSSRGSNFQSPPVDSAYPFPAGSPTFQTTSAATSAGFRCPKGSPVSGYESSSSIYSDSVSSNSGDNNNNNNATPNSATISYRFDLKVQNINGDLPNNNLISPTPKRPFIPDEHIPLLHPPTHINHVQRWLDQESGIRQGIALYV